ncbi:NADPH:quinone oxidoreductase family protein [Profundibacter amoris]|uniref:NADPH:quinone oxidoreductase family protein n=1 Tax=Profundibacter amoris TaxID=2171755 RepID=A0A347UHY4_9RHOB|nr:NADPH:quinone oxidoreductase family protein [Profundibacter amoris]AXX98462.1 NADPH:quinone oxidoreductase family protein [Profundibacter amoris]
MRAFQLLSQGEPANLIKCDRPNPASDEIRLKIEACGLNFGDLLMIKGTYQERPALPFTLGMEPAGVVDAVGEDVTNLKPGDRVAVYHGHGGLAEYGCFPAANCNLLPDNMTTTVGAGFLVAYGTSHLALEHRARLKAGETLLVLGAAGGIGLTAIEIGKRMGATVIACARGRDKLEIAANAGADHLIDSDTDDLHEVVKSLGGADVVYDPVGGDLFKAALRACNPEARIIPLGFASGQVPQIPANILLVKNIDVIGYYWGGYLKFAPKVLHDSLDTLLEWYAAGELHPHISHTLPLEQANEALELLRSRKSTGKVVVTI